MSRRVGEAALSRRGAAFLIDLVAITTLFVAVFMAALLPPPGEEPGAAFNALSLLFLPLGFLLLARDAFGGAGLGKRLCGIAVRREGANAPQAGFGALLLRNVTIPIWPVEALVAASSRRRRRLGDRLAATRVVADESVSGRSRAVLAVGLVLALAACLVIGAWSMTEGLKNSELYGVATEAVRADEDVLAAVGAVERFGRLPSYSARMSGGAGEAVLLLKACGPRGCVDTRVELVKVAGEMWRVERLAVGAGSHRRSR